MKWSFIILFMFGTTRAGALIVENKAQELNCEATIAATNSKEMLCFRNDVIDLGLPTETRGCSIRRYDVERNVFVGFPDRAQNQMVLGTELCENGGLDSILDWPVSETKFVENELESLFNTTQEIQTWGTEKASRLHEMIQKLKLKILQNKMSKGALPNAAGAPNPNMALNSPIKSASPHTNVQVFFAADRQFQANKPPRETFTNERNQEQKLNLGSVSVSIPANHKFGTLELPEVFTMQMSVDPDQYVVLKSVQKWDHGKFWTELQNRVQGSKKKELFVFVHGFNVSFEEAAQRTAQMAYDLKFPGAPVFYSWPSETILRYAVAEKNVEWTLPHLTAFLKDLTEKSGATEIHLIAHSMGNRALTNALNSLAQTRPTSHPPLFKNVILAAPDVDQQSFKQIAASVRSTTSSLTLYASRNDRALQISERVHKAPRLGQTGDDLVTSQLLDTVDASAVDVSFLGHSYYGDNPSVVTDIANVIINSLSVFERPFLKSVQTITGNPYWKMLLPN